jgi:hypothetical protein
MYRVSATVRSTQGQDGTVLLDISQGQILRLNFTGSLIFQRLQRGETEAQITQGISHDFGACHQRVQTDVREFLNSLEQKGLVYRNTSMEGR